MSGIIFEGPDAGGKSTLARKIAQQSGRELFLAGGKPRDEAHMWEMIRDQALALEAGQLVDRVSSISQQVYREGLFFRQDLMDIVHSLVDEGNILVYCRPPDSVMLDPKNHEWKSYDTEDWKRTILEGQPEFIRRYDLLMSHVPCIIYDWTAEEATHIEQVLVHAQQDGVMVAIGDLIRRPMQS